MFGFVIRVASNSIDQLVIEPTTPSEREWYQLDRQGHLVFWVHKAYCR